MTFLGDGIPEDAVWSELPDVDLPEIRWYKDMDGEQNSKTFSSGLVIHVSKEKLEIWAKPWKNTLVVKMLGKRVIYKMLENKLRRSWVQYVTFKITDLVDDFFFHVQLSSIGDYINMPSLRVIGR